MHIHRKLGRFRAITAAVVLGIGALAAVPTSTQTAIASNAEPAVDEDTCSDVIDTPYTWQRGRFAPGVTICVGTDSVVPPDFDAYVQIVDLNAGAKVRLMSEGCFECDHNDDVRFTDVPFHKRTAGEWFDWLHDPANFRTPGPGRLFSVSNGSFFVDSSVLSSTSTLSMPETSLVEKFPDGDAEKELTWGKAWQNGNEAWDQPKRAISFGDASASKQRVEMALNFPLFHYDDDDVDRLLLGVSIDDPTDINEDRIYGDATVGFPPDFDAVGFGHEDRRTFVGLGPSIDPADRVYILNTAADITVNTAEDILTSFGAATTIQLDGGGSTQLAVDNGFGAANYLIDSDDIPLDRAVPEALVVYTAP